MIKKFPAGLECRAETMIAEAFTAICHADNRIADDEARILAKLEFYLSLRDYLKEMKNNAGN